MTTYTFNVVVVWVWLTIIIATKRHTVTEYLYHCHIVTSNHRQFWMVTDREPGLSSKYGDVPLTSQYLQVFFSKLWEIDRCWLYTLNGMELLHNLQHCSNTFMCTIHFTHLASLEVRCASHHTQEYLYIKLKYWTGTWAYKLNENAHNTDFPGD